jgi:hypothetical protein
MCYDCWEDIYGAPKIVNDKVRLASTLIKDLYDYAMAGGNLHVIVDDFNVGDIDFKWHRKLIKQDRKNPSDFSMGEPQYFIENSILDLFEQMTIEERASALGLHDGYFEDNGYTDNATK